MATRSPDHPILHGYPNRSLAIVSPLARRSETSRRASPSRPRSLTGSATRMAGKAGWPAAQQVSRSRGPRGPSPRSETRRRCSPGSRDGFWPPRPPAISTIRAHQEGRVLLTDAPAELVELREAEDLGVLDHHERGLGNVHADLHDGRRDEDADPAGREIRQDARPLLRRHAAVQRPDAHARRAAAAIRSAVSPRRRHLDGAPPRSRGTTT